MDIRWILALTTGLLFVAVFLSGYALLMTRPNVEERLRGARASSTNAFRFFSIPEKI